VILADLEDFSYKEIAEIMECPAGTVMSRLYRGRKMLQQLLYSYAVEQGIIKESTSAGAPPAAPPVGRDAEAATIDLASYRRSQRAKGQGGGGA